MVYNFTFLLQLLVILFGPVISNQKTKFKAFFKKRFILKPSFLEPRRIAGVSVGDFKMKIINR